VDVLYAIGVLVFALGLLASIALHEVGHMVPAKRFGVKVTQYMVGFGPTLWSKHKGDTEYGVKAIPLGGYIRMIGMVPPRADGKPSRWPRRMATAVEEFRSASRVDVVSAADEPRQFYRLTPGKKMIVMVGGPSMNFLIYLVLTILLITVVGQRHDDATTTVATVETCVVPASSSTAAPPTTACPANAVKAPAAGVLQPGDVIEGVNGAAVTSWNDAVKVIQASPGKAVALTIKRAGVDQTVSITPVENENYAAGTSTIKKVGYIGVESQVHSYYKAQSLAAVPGAVGTQVRQGLDALGSYPSKIHSLWQTVFEGKARDPNGAIGIVGLGEIGGQVASSHNFDLRDKVFLLLSLLASVNLLLFFFNLLPLLPLDGGHVAGAMVEAVKRGRARLRVGNSVAEDGTVKVREPIYVDTAQMLPVVYTIASVLVLMTLLVVYADIVKPISIGG
jgi:membrane-associated protease RseP (regulator of RpoE activity)